MVDSCYLKKFGSNLLGVLNDLKRDVPTAAKELGFSEEHLQRIIDGKVLLPDGFVEMASEVWPINARDLHIFQDDTEHGVVIMRAADSEATSRVLDRGGSPYYEYRDTAMSRGAPFRPEWIKELVIVRNNDPENRIVHWNRGHFMHQFTWFSGPVNFYWQDAEGERHCEPMDTGDSMYITPYVPHTFTTRDDGSGRDGLIIAVTFGGKLFGDGQQELSFLGPELARGSLFDYSDPEKAHGSLLRYFVDQINMPTDVLARESGVHLELLQEFLSGANPSDEYLRRIARALGVTQRDLTPIRPKGSLVEVLKHGDARTWESNGYGFRELVRTPRLPYMRAFEVTPGEQTGTLRIPVHQYVFNVSDRAAKFCHNYVGNFLRPGDSAYIKPGVVHVFENSGPAESKFLIVRLGGRLSGDTLHELSLLDRRGFERLCGETTGWYDPEGTS